MLNNLLASYYSSSSSTSSALLWSLLPLGIVMTVVLIILFTTIIPKKKRRNRAWARRKAQLEERKAQFVNATIVEKIRADINYGCKCYFGRQSADVFAFVADLTAKKLAVASFEDDVRVVLDFDEITGFAIVDGVQNSVIDSYSVGGNIGYGAMVGRTTSVQQTFVGNVKLKIETKRAYEPFLITMFLDKFNVNSPAYLEARNDMEKMKTLMIRIVEENKKAEEEAAKPKRKKKEA